MLALDLASRLPSVVKMLRDVAALYHSAVMHLEAPSEDFAVGIVVLRVSLVAKQASQSTCDLRASSVFDCDFVGAQVGRLVSS